MVYRITVRLAGMKALTDSECTRIHLRGSRIEKIFWWGIPPHSPRWSTLTHALTYARSYLHPTCYLSSPSNSILEPPLVLIVELENMLDNPLVVWHWWDIPHFVGEIELCVKLLQGECMDMGLVQGKAVADMVQFIVWEEVTVCRDLQVVNGTLQFR